MSNTNFKPKNYDDFEQMRSSYHWHNNRLGEAFFSDHINSEEWDCLLLEFATHGLWDSCVEDQFGVSYHSFSEDYAEWATSGNAY